MRITGLEGGWAEGHMAGQPAGLQPLLQWVLGTSRLHRWGPAGLELIRAQQSQLGELRRSCLRPTPRGLGQPDLPIPFLTCMVRSTSWHAGDAPIKPQEGPAIPCMGRPSHPQAVPSPSSGMWPFPGGPGHPSYPRSAASWHPGGSFS